jgi:hypothetical protein
MTAVEWFAKQVLRSRQLGFISNEKFNELLEQAKEMEKEQIEKLWTNEEVFDMLYKTDKFLMIELREYWKTIEK